MAKAKSSARVLLAASEIYPLIKTGGLADIVGSLPGALARVGVECSVIVPGYPTVLKGLTKPKTLTKWKELSGGPAKLLSGVTADGVNLIALDAPHLFGFEGNPYQDKNGVDYPENPQRFSVFSKVAAQLVMGELGTPAFNVLHAHDWQAGLACAYLKAAGSTVRSAFTIHNLAFQGNFDKAIFKSLDLPESYFSESGLEYWDKVSFMKAGLVYADHITTVSPTYALEIQSDEGGMGFGGLLKSRSAELSGILNGLDTDVWNPETDSEIEVSFSAKSVAGKNKCKAALQKQLGLRRSAKGLLFCVISRLTTQKGLDLVPDMVDYIVSQDGQLALLGSGDSAIEQAFLFAAERHPTEVSVTIGYDEKLAHKLQAGSDVIIIPSRFEPCGLTQLCAMRYGTIPLVGRTGGLADTVIDASPMALAKGCATGVHIHPINGHMLYSGLAKVFALYKDKKLWAKLRKNALTTDVGWDSSAAKYRELYETLTA